MFSSDESSERARGMICVSNGGARSGVLDRSQVRFSVELTGVCVC